MQMTLWRSEHSPRYELSIRSPGHRLDRTILLATTAALGALLIWSVPPHLIMPTLGIASFLVAGLIGALAYWLGADRHTVGISAWDIAGAFALIWVTAGMLSEPQQVAELFGLVTRAQ